jgi:aryl-phospho-beta-D-glucosidase BglC (GH1 family)
VAGVLVAALALPAVAEGRPLAHFIGAKSQSGGAKARPPASAKTKRKAKAKARKKRPRPAPAPVVDPGRLAPLTVAGNQILRDGRPFHFHGVNRDSLEWGRENYGGCGGDDHFTDRDFDLIRSWGATAVRLPLSQAGWLGRTCPGAAYVRAVDDAIAQINARGMYAIVDLHWSDNLGRSPCPAICLTGQQPMPDGDSLVFWRQVAQRYGANPGVIFGLFNEPHDVAWGCWRDGGCTVSPAALTGGILAFTAVGMQQLYDAVRAQGAQNLVLVGGLQYAYDLSGVGAGFALQGHDIAYDTHVYTLFHNTTADWDRGFGFLTDTHPVVSTEFGSNDCSTRVTAPLLQYFEAPMGKPANRMSWTIWSWNNPGNCLQPSVIADWNGTPLGAQGALVKQTMQAANP